MSEPDDLKAWSKNDLVREVRKLRHLLSDQLRPAADLSMESGSTAEGKPFLTIRWGEQRGQLSPDEARLHALRMLETAEGAESDSCTVTFLKDQGFDEAGIGGFLTMQREYRERWKKELRGGRVLMPSRNELLAAADALCDEYPRIVGLFDGLADGLAKRGESEPQALAHDLRELSEALRVKVAAYRELREKVA